MNLLKSLAMVSSITILSRILGFARDAIIARIFDIEITTDAFFVALKLPNLLRRIFAEGAFSQAFVPILIEYKNKNDLKVTRLFVSRVFGSLSLVLIIVTVLGVLAAPWIVTVIAPGFIDNLDKFILTSQLLRIIFPYILLISLSSLAGAILNTWNYFLIPAFVSVFLNITIICFALFLSSYFNPPIFALAWAIVIGGVLQLVYQLQYLKRINMLVLPRISLHDIGVINLIKQMGPAIFSTSINQISFIMNTSFASFLIPGSISWMYYADRLVELPSGVLGAALSTILLPSLSKSFSNRNYDQYCYLMDWGLRLCFLLALPSIIALAILAKPLIIILFQYGKFTINDVMMTREALIAYSIGVFGLIITKVLAPGFYSCKDTKTPVKISIITLIVTQLLNLVFISFLKHTGLSLSVSFTIYLNAAILYWQLRKRNIFIPRPGWSCFLLQLIIAVLTMTTVLLWTLHIMSDWNFSTIPHQLLYLSTGIVMSLITYFSMLSILGFKIKEFINQINNQVF